MKKTLKIKDFTLIRLKDKSTRPIWSEKKVVIKRYSVKCGNQHVASITGERESWKKGKPWVYYSTPNHLAKGNTYDSPEKVFKQVTVGFKNELKYYHELIHKCTK